MSTSRVVAAAAAALLLITAAVAFLWLKTVGLSAQKKPSNFEYAIANFALGESIPASARNLENPLKSSPELLAAAEREFHQYCAACHGDDGMGNTQIASGMSPEVPDLHADHVQKWTDGELFFIIRNGVRFTGMPGWNFDDDRIWRLVLKLRTFRRASARFPSYPSTATSMVADATGI
jgi:mono/diheme cytochrome c family protein